MIDSPPRYTPGQIEAARFILELDHENGEPEDPLVARIAALPLPEEQDDFDWERSTPGQIEAARFILELDSKRGRPEDPDAARIAALPLPQELASSDAPG